MVEVGGQTENMAMSDTALDLATCSSSDVAEPLETDLSSQFVKQNDGKKYSRQT